VRPWVHSTFRGSTWGAKPAVAAPELSIHADSR